MAKKEIDQATLDRYNKGYEVSYLNLDSIGQFKRRQAVKKAEKQNGEKAERVMHHSVNYAKYGYYFLIPFFLIFLIFNLLPLMSTFVYAFFEYFFKLGGLQQVGPNFIGIGNFATLFTDINFWKYWGNTLIIWICCFIPQMIVSLLLAIWFTDSRLKVRCSGFFKAIMYMPNLVMAAAFGMLFLMLFGNNGPINQIFEALTGKTIFFTESTGWSRGILSFANWLMWFGNTTILLMSGIMGIDESIFESARLDGSSSVKTFFHITLPLLMPIFVYVLVTSMIGGIQLFDVVQIFTRGNGGPNLSTKTIMMYLYDLIKTSKNYGLAGAVSFFIFLITGGLSIIIFKCLVPSANAIKAEKKAYRKRMRWLNNGKREKGGEVR